MTRLITLDVAPTLAMYEQTSFDFARAYWHWFMLVRPAPFPETLIRADPDLYLKQTIGARSAGLAPFTPAAYAEYLRCLSDPDTAHGICEDYRASVTIDLEHDRATLASGQHIACPFMALWGAQGVIEQCFDPLAEWRAYAPKRAAAKRCLAATTFPKKRRSGCSNACCLFSASKLMSDQNPLPEVCRFAHRVAYRRTQRAAVRRSASDERVHQSAGFSALDARGRGAPSAPATRGREPHHPDACADRRA